MSAPTAQRAGFSGSWTCRPGSLQISAGGCAGRFVKCVQQAETGLPWEFLATAVAAWGSLSSLRPCAYLWRGAATSRVVRLMRTAKRETTAYFESLNIQSTGDVVRHWVHTTSVSADLVRGPGGKGEGSKAVHKAIEEAKAVCNSFLPRVLRDEKSVSQILDLLCNALSLAGDPSSRDAFAALESPLVSFHDNAPVAMRKALQGRFSGIAEKLVARDAPEAAHPLGIALEALGAAIRGPGNLAKWKPPEILQLRSQSRWKMPLQVRAMILARDSETCWYCGAPGDTVDHWIPLCRGGTNKTVNLVCACSECNELKGNSMPEEFLADRKSVV